MSIVIAPIYEPAGVYRPVKWLINAGSSNPVEKAVVQVENASGILATLTYSLSFQVGVLYFFEVDVQKVLQTLLAPTRTKTSVFGTLNQSYLETNTDCFDEVFIRANYLERDPTTGLLEDLSVTDLSDPVLVNIVTRQHTENQSQDEFEPLFSNTNKRFLTNAPLVKAMRAGENEFLTFLSDAGAGDIQVKTFKSDNTLIDTGTFAVDVNPDFDFQTIGVGYENIKAQVWATGSVDITDTEVAYYTVELIGLLNEPYLEVRRYNLIKACSPLDIRVHWLNLLGGADAYTFTTRNDELINNQNEIGRKTLTWDETQPTPHSQSDFGKFSYNSFGIKRITIESDFVDEDVARYLTEVKLSNEKYIEQDGELVPFVVSSVDTVIKTTSQGNNLVRVLLELELSNDIIVQSR